MADPPVFFVPDTAVETAESVYADFAKWCGSKVPAPRNRVYSITWLHGDEEWTATVGEPLRGIRCITTRGKKIERRDQLRDPAIVLAIFPDVPFKVVTNHFIDGKTSVRSAWVNPFLAGSIKSITYFTVSPNPELEPGPGRTRQA